MKNHRLLTKHITPFQEGCNILRYSNTNGDTYVGEIEAIFFVADERSAVSRVILNTMWVARIQRMTHIDGKNGLTRLRWQAVNDSIRKDYKITFDCPRVHGNSRGDLLFISGSEKVEIRHLDQFAECFMVAKEISLLVLAFEH